MSPSILVVPVDPLPPKAALDAVADRLERAFGRSVRVTAPIRPPAPARLGPARIAADPVRAAIAATWGCGCRDRLVGLTAAEIEGGTAISGCGGVLVLTLSPGFGAGTVIRAVGRSLGLEDCAVPGCAMHPSGEGASLCRACRARC